MRACVRASVRACVRASGTRYEEKETFLDAMDPCPPLLTHQIDLVRCSMRALHKVNPVFTRGF